MCVAGQGQQRDKDSSFSKSANKGREIKMSKM
jgi:hypothetical protein